MRKSIDQCQAVFNTLEDIGWVAPVWLRAGETIDKAYAAMRAAECDGALVRVPGQEPGTIGFIELQRLVMRGGVDLMSPVGEYAAICPFQAKPQSDIQSTYNQMRRCSLTIAPVVGPDGLLGIVTCCALARALRQNRRARLRLAGTRVG